MADGPNASRWLGDCRRTDGPGGNGRGRVEEWSAGPLGLRGGDGRLRHVCRFNVKRTEVLNANS